ncbi:hypothetical protein J6590_026922 [Homalodisca vitripennis]|nr:hypothetical protein J6590_026922 [Homalodisca vitripennis]
MQSPDLTTWDYYLYPDLKTEYCVGGGIGRLSWKKKHDFCSVFFNREKENRQCSLLVAAPRSVKLEIKLISTLIGLSANNRISSTVGGYGGNVHSQRDCHHSSSRVPARGLSFMAQVLAGMAEYVTSRIPGFSGLQETLE